MADQERRMRVDDIEILNYLNDLMGKPVFNKKRMNVDELEHQLKFKMKQVGYGLRKINTTLNEKSVDRMF